MTQSNEEKFVLALEKLTQLTIKHDKQINELSRQVVALIQQVNQLTQFANRNLD